MGAMVTVLATGIGLVVLGVREIREVRARRAMHRRLLALWEDADAWAARERIRAVMAD